MRILVTNNWTNNVEDVIATIDFVDSPKANFLVEMLKMQPDSFRFEIDYAIS